MALENNFTNFEFCVPSNCEKRKVDYDDGHIQFYKFESGEWIPYGKLIGLKQLTDVISEGNCDLELSPRLKEDLKKYNNSIKQIKLKVF